MKILMSLTLTLLSALVWAQTPFEFAANWSVSPMTIDIPNAGRVDAIAYHPTSPEIIIVGTESGGLFESTDGARSFVHVDSFPMQNVRDVGFNADGSVLIATAGTDFKQPQQGGIWISRDVGETWSRIPTTSYRVDAVRQGGYGISFGPKGQILVGTSDGLEASDDSGASWRLILPWSPSHWADQSVAAVKVGSDGTIFVACGGDFRGLLRSRDRGTTWETITGTGTRFWEQGDSVQCLDVAGNGIVAFADKRGRLYLSENNGDTWRRIDSALGRGRTAGGNMIVRLSAPTDFNLDLYYGNCFSLYHMATARPDGGLFDIGLPLNEAVLPHADTRYLAFQPNGTIGLLGSDGGLNKTDDRGRHWSFAAGCAQGLCALQITEVTGQWLTDLGRHDIYFGTQDQAMYSSGDGGLTWPGIQNGEGFNISAVRRTTNALSRISSQLIAGRDDVISAFNFLASPLFGFSLPFPDPIGPVMGAPKVISPGRYLQPIRNSMGTGMGISDESFAWSLNAPFSESPFGVPQVVTGRSFMTTYQPIKVGTTDLNVERVQLVKISQPTIGGGVSVRYPNMVGFGGFGVTPTMFARYEQFAVDPGDPRHLIAVDAIGKKVMSSHDGGETWLEIPGLAARLGIVEGHLLGGVAPLDTRSTSVTAISFCPDNPTYVLIGTNDQGVFSSTDRGETFDRVPTSGQVKPITSFHWRNWNNVIVSTYGRGLWRMNGELRLRRAWQPLAQQLNLTTINLGQLPLALPRAWFGFQGRIQGAEAVNGKILRIYISPGTDLLPIDDAKVKLGPAPEVVETIKNVGFKGFSQFPANINKGKIVVGLGVGDGGVAKLLVADAPINWPDAEDKTVWQTTGIQPSPYAKLPTIVVTHASLADPNSTAYAGPVFPFGEKPIVRGTGFDPGTTDNLVVYLDGSLIRPVAKWDKDGSFRIEIAAILEIGQHTITVRQKTSKGLAADRATFSVCPFDPDGGDDSQPPKGP